MQTPAEPSETASSDPAASGIDVSRAHSARMYDYYLGGKDHFAADRVTAEKAMRGTSRASRLATAIPDGTAKAETTEADGSPTAETEPAIQPEPRRNP